MRTFAMKKSLGDAARTASYLLRPPLERPGRASIIETALQRHCMSSLNCLRIALSLQHHLDGPATASNSSRPAWACGPCETQGSLVEGLLPKCIGVV